MNFYKMSSKVYDILDKTYFAEKGKNPRKVIESMIPNEPVKILDLCCGTLSNTITIAQKYSNVKILGVDISKEKSIECLFKMYGCSQYKYKRRYF